MAVKAKAPKVEANHVKKSANDLLFSGQNEVIMYILWSLIISCFCACCWRGLTHRDKNRRRRRKTLTEKRKLKVEKEEEDLELEVKRAESKLAAKRIQRQVISARVEQDNMETELTELQDEKGRLLYGDAWDNPQDDSVPIKELFGLNEEELREIKIEAYNRMAREEKERNGGRGTIESARLKSTIADYRNVSSTMNSNERSNSMLLSSRLENLNHHGNDYEDESAPLILTSDTTFNTKRSTKPMDKAPFDDPRFVRPRPTNGYSSWAQEPGLTNPLPPPLNSNGVWMQKPGLSNPAPPKVPPPTSGVWMQKPGLSNPLPPKLPPLTNQGGSSLNVDEWKQRTPRLLESLSPRNSSNSSIQTRIGKTGDTGTTGDYEFKNDEDSFSQTLGVEDSTDEEEGLIRRRSPSSSKKSSRRNQMV